MAQITGAVNLTGMIAPFETENTYPTHNSIYGKGGYREVSDQTDRDNISADRRTIGMMVYQQDVDKHYVLKNGITNSDWVEVSVPVNTDNLLEGSTNLYYTDARVDARIPTNVSVFTNDAGYLTSYTETDPVYTASSWFTTTNNSTNWDTAYGWGDHSIQSYATETYVNNAVSNLIDAAPSTLDTLNELAAALGDDPNFATTIATNIATKVSKSGDTMTGALTLSGAPVNPLHAATKAYVDSAVSSGTGALDTDDIPEGITNLYYTNARVDARIPTNISAFTNDAGYLTSETDSQTLSFTSPNLTISNGNTVNLSTLASSLTTTNLAEGTNLYFTNERVDDRVATLVQAGQNITVTYNDALNTLTISAATQIGGGYDLSNNTTDDLTEGAANLYFTATRVNTAFDSYVTGGTGVDVTNGVISIGQSVGTTDDVTFNNMIVDGNLTVNGTTTTINATELAIEDNMIYLNDGSTVTNPDLGWVGNYNDGTYAHAGVFRDASDGVFKFFDGYTPEPGQTIDTSHATFSFADIKVENALLNSSPTNANHATTKAYVDSATSSLSNTVSNLTTDDIAEGLSNLYYTNARSRAAISVTGSLGYNSTTGVISYTQPTNVSAFTNDAGYLTSYTETDPTVPAHVKSITTTEKSNWNTAYGWGDHSTQGYLTAETDSQTLSFTSPNLTISNGNTVNLSALLDDTNLARITSAGFNTADGILTLTRNDSSTVTVDLDGRYLTSFTDTNDIDYINSASFNTSDGVLTLSGVGNAGATVDLDGRYLQSYTETDPTVPAHVKSITTTEKSNWNTAYGWGDHSTQNYATQTYVNTAVTNLVDAAPATLDTLNELAAALGDDPNFATTISNQIGLKQDAATALTTSTQFGGDVSGTYGAIVVANDSHTHSNYMTNNAATQFNAGRGAVYVENNSSDNVDGAGITFRTSSNPGTTTTSGGIFSVRSSGNGNRLWVGQGLTSSGTNPFYVGGNSNVNSSTGSANPANYAIEFATNGTITATGDVCAYGTISDRRQKENVLKLENALDKVNQLNGYTFNYIGKEDRMTGVMAQEVAEVLPEAVFETKAFGAEETTMAVRHGNMVGLLIEAIKELTEQNRQMAAEIKTLKNNM